MGHGHGLYRVSNELPAGQWVLHPLVTHGDPVADADSVKFNRGATGHTHTDLNGIGNAIQVHMPGHDFVL